MDHDELDDKDPLEEPEEPVEGSLSDEDDFGTDDEEDPLEDGFHVVDDDYEPPTDF